MMETDEKLIDFSKPMIVLKIGARLRKPYHKKPFLYVDKSTLTSPEDFRSFLLQESRTWDNGTYVLKAAKQGDNLQGTRFFFAEFQKEEQNIRKLLRASTNTGRPYLCWNFFERGVKK